MNFTSSPALSSFRFKTVHRDSSSSYCAIFEREEEHTRLIAQPITYSVGMSEATNRYTDLSDAMESDNAEDIGRQQSK